MEKRENAMVCAGRRANPGRLAKPYQRDVDRARGLASAYPIPSVEKHPIMKKAVAKRRADSGVEAWLDAFAARVRARDFAGGRALFAREAHGFGTVARVVRSLDALEREQWSRVWPVTSGFRFERRGLRIEASPDGLLAVAMATWKACNRPSPARTVFDRRGRATVVLRRAGAAAPWIAEHTHFSFDPPARARR